MELYLDWIYQELFIVLYYIVLCILPSVPTRGDVGSNVSLKRKKFITPRLYFFLPDNNKLFVSAKQRPLSLPLFPQLYICGDVPRSLWPSPWGRGGGGKEGAGGAGYKDRISCDGGGDGGSSKLHLGSEQGFSTESTMCTTWLPLIWQGSCKLTTNEEVGFSQTCGRGGCSVK